MEKRSVIIWDYLGYFICKFPGYMGHHNQLITIDSIQEVLSWSWDYVGPLLSLGFIGVYDTILVTFFSEAVS